MSAHLDYVFCIQKSPFNGLFHLTILNNVSMDSRRLLMHDNPTFTTFQIQLSENEDMDPQYYPLQVAARFNNAEYKMYVYCVIATAEGEIKTLVIKL